MAYGDDPSSSSSMIGAIIFFIIIAAIIGVTVWLIVREFRLVNKKITTTAAAQQASLSNLSTNVTQNYLLRGDFATASNGIKSAFSSVNTSLDSTSASLSTQSNLIKSLQVTDKAVDDRWNKYFSTSNIYGQDTSFLKVQGVEAEGVIGKHGLGSTGFYLFENSENMAGQLPTASIGLNPQGEMQLRGWLPSNDVVTATKARLNELQLGASKQQGQPLNVTGKLNFATANSSYMLGVDGTSMFLKMADESDAKLQLRTPNNTPILTVDGRTSLTQVDGDIAVKGCIRQAGGTGASICFDNNAMALNGTRIQTPQLSIGQYTLKEDANGSLVVTKGTTDVAVLSPEQQINKLVLRNTSGGSHTQMTAGVSNLTLIP